MSSERISTNELRRLQERDSQCAALREALGAGLLLAQMPGVDMAAWVVMARKVLENTK